MAVNEGETVVLRTVFRDASGNLVDPSPSVQVTVEREDGTEDGPHVMSKVKRGVFTYEYTVQDEGTHHWKVETGDGFIEGGDSFYAYSPFENVLEKAPVTPPVGVDLSEALGKDDPIYTDESFDLTFTTLRDLTNGTEVQAYLVDETGARHSWGPTLTPKGSNEEYTSTDRAEDVISNEPAGAYLVQWTFTNGANEEETLKEESIIFTSPAND